MSMLALHTRHPVERDAARIYSGHETAVVVGLSWERFRKVRQGWTRDRDFPAEINEPGEPVRYLADAVDAWVRRRSRRVHAAAPASTRGPTPPAPDAPYDVNAARAGRARLRLLKGTA